MCGVLCVMTPGEMLRQLWCADSWDTQLKVSNKYIYYNCLLPDV